MVYESIKTTNVDGLLQDLDPNDITSVIKTWGEISDIRKTLIEVEDMLKNKVKVFLKEKKWKRYNDDENKISVSLSTQKREVIDKGQLKLILNESQIAQVTKTTTFEKLSIVTPKTRQGLKDYVIPKKK